MSRKTQTTETTETAPVVPETVAAPTPVTTVTEPVALTIEEVDVPKRAGRKSTLSYPIASLTPGTKQSFFLPAIDEATAKKVGTSVRTFASRNGFRVQVADVQGGVRVWRKADPTPAEAATA